MNLVRKERECEVKTKEKEEVMRTVTMLKGKYEGEVERRKKAEDELKDAEIQKEKLQYNVSLHRTNMYDIMKIDLFSH